MTTDTTIETTAGSASIEDDCRGAFRLRRDAVYLRTDAGILFRSIDETFALKGATTYSVFQRLLPYLDGKRPLGLVLDSVPAASRAPLTALLERLRDKRVIDRVDIDDAGVIEPAIADRFAPQIEFIAHYGPNPNTRFLAFRDSAILLAGSGVAHREAGSALLRNGLRTLWIDAPDSLDLTPLQETADALRAQGLDSRVVRHDPRAPVDFQLGVYCAEDPVLATLDRMNRSAVERGIAFLPAYALRAQSFIGPMVVPERAGCWHCTLLRWADNAPAREADDAGRRLARGARQWPARETSESAAQILGNGTAMEVFKFFALPPAAESRHRLLLQDMASLGSELKSVLPHPECPVCGAAGTLSGAGSTSPTHSPPGVAAAPGDARLLESWAPFLDAKVGVFRGFDDDGIEQLPLRLTRLLPSRAAAERLGDPDAAITAWSLLSSDAARAEALRRAVALSTLEGHPAHLQRASRAWVELDHEQCLLPETLYGWQGSRGESPAAHRYLRVRRAGMPGTGRDALAWAPAGAVHHRLDEQACFDPFGAGIGCGFTADEALVQAMRSLCGHLALAGLADGSLRPNLVKPWRGRLGTDVDYLSTAAGQLGHHELQIGLLSPRSGMFAAVEATSVPRTVRVDDLQLGVGFTPAEAVGDLLAAVVARAQLARHGIGLPALRRDGVLAGAELTFACATTPVDPGDTDTAPRGPAASASARTSSTWWWLDITPPEVALTGTLRVVKVLLDRMPANAADATPTPSPKTEQDSTPP